ncbi:unnamed protein product, partial [Staurois parvus]
NYQPAPSDYVGSPTGRRGALFTNSPPPYRLGHTALDGCAQHSHPEQGAYSEAATHSKTLPAHSYPLIAPHVNPFLPSAISTVSVLFFSTHHCIGVTGDVSDIKSVPPHCQNARCSLAISH